MKLLVLTVVIVLVAGDKKYKVREDIAEQWDHVTESHTKECLKESGEKEEYVLDMFKKGHFPNTPKFKHYIKCLSIKLNFVSEDGVFNEERVRTMVKAADLDIFERCLAAVNDEKDIYEKIYSYNILFVEEIAKRYPSQH